MNQIISRIFRFFQQTTDFNVCEPVLDGKRLLRRYSLTNPGCNLLVDSEWIDNQLHIRVGMDYIHADVQSARRP